MSETQTETTETTTNTTTNTTTATDGVEEQNLTTEEMSVLGSLRKSANDVVSEIGQIEVRKARLLGSLSEIEARAQNVLNTAGTRLNIPEGTPWQVTPEGKVVMLPEGMTPPDQGV